jgi:hypothetical protein
MDIVMLEIRCKNCNVSLKSNNSQLKCCGCDNMTTLSGDKISAKDLSLVVIVSNTNTKDVSSHFTLEDLKYQESRRKRKIRRLDFEVR